MNVHKNELIEQYWQYYLSDQPDPILSESEYVADQFGDSPQLADELAKLILAGTKTATCSALWEWEAEGNPLPELGSKLIVLDGNNQPCCIIKTIEVTVRPFIEIDAQFAYDEGEDDRSLEAWRREHWKYFSRVLPKIGKEATPSMPLVCERFCVVYK